MQKKERSCAACVGSIILLLFALCFTTTDCTKYNPSFYTGYDILNPSAAVRANPLGTLEQAEGEYKIKWGQGVTPSEEHDYFIVDENFLNWVYELKEEIKRLR